MSKQEKNAETLGYDRRLPMIGGGAALIAGIVFRRNISAEIHLFTQQETPQAVGDWFELLQSNRLLGLALLNIFDIVNYAFVGLMFLALYAVLRRVSNCSMLVATAVGLVGITVYFSSNTALSLLSLSHQHAVATTEAQKGLLLAAGEAMLAINRFSGPGAYPGAGGYLSLLLVAVAGMIVSIVMLRSALFSRATAIVGILASALDLAYCITYVFMTAVDSSLLAVCFIPAAGLMLMIWHILIGRRLVLLARLNRPEIADC